MATDDTEEKKTLFTSCAITFVPHKTYLPSALIDKYTESVIDNGGQVVGLDREGKLRLDEVTHVVAGSIDFEQYTEAQAKMVPVVVPSWLKASLNRCKLAQLRPYTPDPRFIFSSVVVSCHDIPRSDQEAIVGAVMAMGGMESKELSKQTTHLCALSMDEAEVEEITKKFRGRCKVVLPHWFDDCFKLGSRISEGPYLLPKPDILEKTSQGQIRIPTNEKLQGATSVNPGTMIEGSARETFDVFSGRKVVLSPDLPIREHLRGVLGALIASSKGEVVRDVDDCDMFICQYRDGHDYVRAARLGKHVGNLAWLYYLIVHNSWSSPLNKLLHYPIPRNGIPGFKDKKIALSNYGGEARIYLENLITACGATYTKTMKSDNTHLITARLAGDKCDAAKEWGIEILNHLWIEDSYAKCEMQALTVPRFTCFPAQTNLGEVIGQTFFVERKLRDMFYPGEDDDLGSDAAMKRQINDAAQANMYTVGQEPGLSSPAVAKAKNKKPARVAQKNANAKISDVTVRGKGSRGFDTPAKQLRPTGKENYTPSVVSTGSRSAKQQALHKLQDLAPDLALYEKEKKRTTKDAHGPWGGKRAADEIDKVRSEGSASAVGSDADDTDVKRPSKRHKALPAITMRVCLTGYQRWIDQKSKEDGDRRKLRSMGILILQKAGPTDYLAAPNLKRTMKFLQGLASGAKVINSSFIDACLETGEIPDTDQHLLEDRANEEKYGVTIKDAVARAQRNKGHLLRGVAIYCTADISNGVDSFQAVAEANGALFKTYNARSGVTIRPTTAEQDGGADPEPVYLLTSGTPVEKKLWPKFEKMAREGHMEPRVVAVDWLLDVAMRQDIFFDPKYLATEFFKSG